MGGDVWIILRFGRTGHWEGDEKCPMKNSTAHLAVQYEDDRSVSFEETLQDANSMRSNRRVCNRSSRKRTGPRISRISFTEATANAKLLRERKH